MFIFRELCLFIYWRCVSKKTVLLFDIIVINDDNQTFLIG
jgi:hypothetical protein